MDLTVLFRAFGLTAAYNHAFAPFVEDLRDAGVGLFFVRAEIEADTDVNRIQVRWSPQEPPRDTSGLVIEGCEKVPSTRGRILKASRVSSAANVFGVRVI